MVMWQEFEAEAMRDTLSLQDAVKRVREARGRGEDPNPDDLERLRPHTEYAGGNLDRLWASEEY